MLSDLYRRLPVSAQNAACSAAAFVTRRRRYTKYFRESLAWLRGTEWWPEERLRELQCQRLQRVVLHAATTVPYYRALFCGLGIHPLDIRTPEELVKVLPILTKQQVRAHPEQFVSDVFRARRGLAVAHTSGTTGAGMSFVQQPRTFEFTAALWWRFRERFGLKLEDEHANFSGAHVVPAQQKTPPYWRELRPLHEVYCSVYHLSPEALPAYFRLLDERAFRYLSGYPSAIGLLAQYMLERGLRLRRPPKVVTTGSETLLPFHRAQMEQVFQCPVVDFYGAAERVCSMSRCEAGRYHVDMEGGILEIDPIESTDEGIVGRVIGTGLVDLAMPMLRYDIGDLVTWSRDRCPCGRASPTALRIDGRTEGVIVTPSGRRLGRLAGLFADLPNVRESQIVQSPKGALVVRVVRETGYSFSDEQHYRSRVQSAVGEEMPIAFQYLERIPREANGKFRAVVSRFAAASGANLGDDLN